MPGQLGCQRVAGVVAIGVGMVFTEVCGVKTCSPGLAGAAGLAVGRWGLSPGPL